MEQTEASIYDFPKYYDLLFGSDWKAEYEFLLGCFDRYAKCDVSRVFEPACGTGRLLIKLAQGGYEVGGNDLNPKAVKFCNDRLEKAGFPASIQIGDMADFKLKKKVHAAFNTINSFRHLDSEKGAESHLKCIANSLTKGGLYVLGLHLTPTQGERTETEDWVARRGHLQVNSMMWSKELDLKKRNEKLGMTIDVYTPTKQFRIVDEMNYRTYTASQMNKLLSTCPELEVAALHDFCYELDTFTEITPTTEDVVFVLRKK
ncbi:class I SAM-dependent methyltransferase [Planctomicrobium sp. SH668]|uniref:class I SAM-dependent methyltransferase n=1 Tax=Planctomicrobium sp. SH668 TaxID=3448126 RepID=UPI003F5B04BA